MLEKIINSITTFDYNQIINNISTEDIFFYSIGITLVILPTVFRKLIGCFLICRFKYFFNKLKIEQNSIETTIKKLKKPFNLIGYLISIMVLIRYFDISDETFIVINLKNSLALVIVFWSIYACIGLFNKKFNQLKQKSSKEMIDWLVRILRILVIFLGIASVLELWGIKVAPLLAGLGLFGVAVALGAQDLFKNIIAGMSVIAEKRFASDEWIKIDGIVEGTVENIGFRSTKITRFDKSPVYVPNTKLADNAVTNFSRMSHRQVSFKIGVLYSTTTQQLKQICNEINEYIYNNDDFDKETSVTFVKIVAFNDSSIDIQIYAFTKTTVWVEWLDIRQELQCKVKEIVEGAGTEFAFPSTSLYLGDDEKEIFHPKKDDKSKDTNNKSSKNEEITEKQTTKKDAEVK